MRQQAPHSRIPKKKKNKKPFCEAFNEPEAVAATLLRARQIWCPAKGCSMVVATDEADAIDRQRLRDVGVLLVDDLLPPRPAFAASGPPQIMLTYFLALESSLILVLGQTSWKSHWRLSSEPVPCGDAVLPRDLTVQAHPGLGEPEFFFVRVDPSSASSHDQQQANW